jgi:hypothetical protein
MHTTTHVIKTSKQLRMYDSPIPSFLVANLRRCGLVFFGTPHAGGKNALVTVGKICGRIVTMVSPNPPNDIMQALQKGSLFTDVLQENWRHQLNSFKIVSFYEGIGDVSICFPQWHASI